MKTYEVVAHQGVGPVRIGVSRAASRAAMNLPFISSVRHEGQPKVDFYHENAFQVFFDVNGEVEYVELSRSDSHAALIEA